MFKVLLIAFGLFALAACDVKARPVDESVAQNSVIHGEQPKGDQGVPGRCAKIVNPAERRKCIQSSG